MRTVAFYRQKASECREMARQISLNEPRDELFKMAADWEELAAEREARSAADLENSPRPPTSTAAGGHFLVATE